MGIATLTSAGTASFGFRKQITIDFNQVVGAANHTDFPVLVSLVDPDLRTTPSGRVENANGFDIETYDGSTGTLVA